MFTSVLRHLRHNRQVKTGIALGLVAVAASFTGNRIFNGPADGVSNVITQAVSNIAKNVGPGTHLGFDTYSYPGDQTMLAWRDESVPFEWVGFYLPAPCHKDPSWSGKREKLMTMGWGLAVIYVGQQTWGSVPGAKRYVTKYVTKYQTKTVKVRGKRVKKRVAIKVPVRTVLEPRARRGSSCDVQLVSADQGTKDANDAITTTLAEGFAAGTVIFLDVERMEKIPTRMRDYYKSWTARVLEDGRFRPGYYTHSHNAVMIFSDVSDVFDAAGFKEEPKFWVAGGKGFSEEKLPQDVGHAFANVWQGLLDVVQTHNGIRLPIDVNVSHVPSPSSNLNLPVLTD
ncbi:MAG: DUF1906 domain-containing protein [Gemmatimonadaceae bacterium]|nr:DUF1906 domain-containing protein [Gemmatimonadaceae bacterium]